MTIVTHFLLYTMVMVVRPLFNIGTTKHNLFLLGSTVAKFAGKNVHRRLLTEDSYKEGNWEAALKKAFLGTDEDLLAS